MAVTSVGFLAYRMRGHGVEVLLAHPGGPLWASKEAGAWSIPKGGPEGDETPVQTAAREWREELGLPAADAERPDAPGVHDLGTVRQAGGKVVHAIAVAHDLDPASIVPGEFDFAWPPRSGRTIRIPEIDRVAWFAPAEAREHLNRAQVAFVDRLLAALDAG
jgi:predicted NUDIX family NTP pyrophosphohydrolase